MNFEMLFINFYSLRYEGGGGSDERYFNIDTQNVNFRIYLEFLGRK